MYKPLKVFTGTNFIIEKLGVYRGITGYRQGREGIQIYKNLIKNYQLKGGMKKVKGCKETVENQGEAACCELL